MKTEGHSHFARAVFTLATALVCAGPLAAQQPPPPAAGAAVGATVRLSLDDALRMAQAQSPNDRSRARRRVRANGQRYQVRSQYLPAAQRDGRLYNKTLKSQFSSFAAAPAPVDTTPKLQSLCTPDHPGQCDARPAPCRAGAGGVVPIIHVGARLRSEQDELRREEPVGARPQLLAERLHRRPHHGAERTPRTRSFARRTSRSSAQRAQVVARRDVGVLRRGARRPTRGDRRFVGRADGSRARADESRAPGRQRRPSTSCCARRSRATTSCRSPSRRGRIARSRTCA